MATCFSPETSGLPFGKTSMTVSVLGPVNTLLAAVSPLPAATLLLLAFNSPGRNQVAGEPANGPALGARAGEAVQAGGRFVWRETVSGTPNAAFRKIEVTVADPGQPDYALAQLVGYVGLPPAR